MTKDEAETLWASLQEAFSNVEKAIQEIIATRAWEPLGYATFAEAWEDRMKGFRLTTTILQATVVYRLLDEQRSVEEVPELLGLGAGVGLSTAQALARQREHGVPVGLASTRGTRFSVPGVTTVRKHERSIPSAPHVIHVELPEGEYANYRALCEARGLDLTTEAANAIRTHFRRLESH